MPRDRARDAGARDCGPPGAESDYVVYSSSSHARSRAADERRARAPRSRSPRTPARRRSRSSSDGSNDASPRARRRERSGSRRRRRRERTPPTRHRDRSFTPPESYKRRYRSTSSSSRSVGSSAESSRSSTFRRSPARDRSRSRSDSASRSPSGTPDDTSDSRSLRTDSDTSSRGRFSGYDRKRYFKKLKEQNAKERRESGSEERAEPAPLSPPSPPFRAGASSTTRPVGYESPPPADAVNFEDLPPPPDSVTGQRRVPPVSIRNDGSFLEMFKRMQEESGGGAGPSAPAPRRPVPPLVGKRRGGRVLKTGIVQKARAPLPPPDAAPQDAWSLYMQEVKKYRETSCEEERKTRPLVK